MLIWNNISHGIIENVNGYAHKSHLTAIMGSSGSGKTTLLTQIYKANNVFLDHEKLKTKHISFVGQNEELFELLTVKESIEIYCRLRGKTNENLKNIIENVNLTNVSESLIKTLSGGERKRLTIAYELTNDLEVFILDEPTTSLDSSMAKTVIDALNSIKHNKYILFSIHQPNVQLFFTFDTVYFLKSGHVCYHGNPIGVLDYCLKLESKCPEYTNPADHLMDLLSEHDRVVPALAIPENIIDVDNVTVKISNRVKTPFLVEFYILLQRAYKDSIRQPLLFSVRIFQSLFFGTIVGLLYYDTPNNISNVNGCIFFITLNQMMGAFFSVLQVFPAQLHLCKQETRKKLYTMVNYFLSKSLVDIPFQLLMLCIFLSISLPLTNLTNDIHCVFQIIIVIFSGILAISSFGYFVSVMCSTKEIAVIIGNLVILPMMLLGGFFIQNNSLPKFLEYFSLFNFAYQGVMHSVYSFSDYECLKEDCIFETKYDVLDYHNIEYSWKYSTFILLGYSGIYRIIALLCLYLSDLITKLWNAYAVA